MFFLLIGNVLYSQLTENESEFWCLWYIFIVKSFVGFCKITFIIIASLCILFVFMIVFVIMMILIKLNYIINII